MSFWILLLFYKRFIRRVWLIWGFVFYCSSLPFTADILLNLWESPLGNSKLLKLDRYDAVVILGGMIEGLSPEGQWRLGESVERLTEAGRLYQEGRALYLLVTGGPTGVFAQSAWRESEVMLDFLLTMGVPVEAILIENQALNTYQNALYSIPLLRNLNLESVLLVTSAFHMRRALSIFQKLGVTPTPYAVDSRKMKLEFPLNLLPSQKAFALVDLVIRECVGFLAYRLVGYL